MATQVTASDDTVYVAVGKGGRDGEYTMFWALQNSGGRRLCILHVHTPAQKIPILLGAKFGIALADEYEVRAHHEKARQEINMILDKYLLLCGQAGAQVEKLCVETDNIEKGIVDLISQHGIRKLVMGATAYKYYSRRMTEVRSKKAMYVCEQAAPFCQIWFICKGKLIYTRQSRPDRVNIAVASPPLGTSPDSTEGHTNQVDLVRSLSELESVQSVNITINLSGTPRATRNGLATFPSSSNVEGSTDELYRTPRRSLPLALHFSACSSGDMADDSRSISLSRIGGRDPVPDSFALCNHCHTSPPSTAVGSVEDEAYDRLEEYVPEAENSRRDAFEESKKCRKAEKEAIQTSSRANAPETMYAEEFSIQRSGIEEVLARSKEGVEQMNMMVQELGQKMLSTFEILLKCKKERDDLEVERDIALRAAEDMSKKLDKEASNSSAAQFYAEFSFSEIKEATSNLDPHLKIGKGGYGSVYRGVLCQTPVAIKIHNPDSSQGPSEFQQEVNVLSKVRHPNLVTLIGACSEELTLVYEYLPNGNLDDCIDCKGNSPPLTWQTRIRIATEIRSALIFLHSWNGQGIVHGDLKPANILLDSNFISKLSDFGICRALSVEELSDDKFTRCCRTDPKGTFVYMDPVFFRTGELTPKSDVYAFGIVLLRLLTGKPALGIADKVQCALDEENLRDLLDPTAGDWPSVQAKQLARLALRCCEIDRRQRPELASEDWMVLEQVNR